ncbi:MAG: DUF3768 domain-containing protein [Kiloniellales bacterium]
MTEQNETDPAMAPTQVRPESETREERVRRLNDELRKGTSCDGSIVFTSGIQAGGLEFVSEVMKAVAAFDSFDEDNDPWNEHDFGALDVRDERVFFKIDYYDRELTGHSPDKSDPAVTKRVLTIMLASEY